MNTIHVSQECPSKCIYIPSGTDGHMVWIQLQKDWLRLAFVPASHHIFGLHRMNDLEIFVGHFPRDLLVCPELCLNECYHVKSCCPPI